MTSENASLVHGSFRSPSESPYALHQRSARLLHGPAAPPLAPSHSSLKSGIGGQALDRLVPLPSKSHLSYTRGLSTRWSLWGLTRLFRWEILSWSGLRT